MPENLVTIGIAMAPVVRCPSCEMPLTGTPEGHLPSCVVRECAETNLASSGYLTPEVAAKIFKSLNDLQARLDALKSATKQYKASEWNEQYRVLACEIHSLMRDHFFVGWEEELKKEPIGDQKACV